MVASTLTAREKLILGEIVQRFITTATPVSSSLISKKSKLGMSPASIRNTMSLLEQKGYIFQPHTSAGRVPRTSAYRMYVDEIIRFGRLSSDEKGSIREMIEQSTLDQDDVLKDASRILSQLSRQLGIIVTPQIDEGIFQRMELISLTSDRLLVVITIQTGMIKTITLELESAVSRSKLQSVTDILNERLFGIQINDIRRKFREIFHDVRHDDSGLMNLFVRQADQLFDFGENVEIYFMGTHHFVQQTDIGDVKKVSSIVELLEERDVIVHLLSKEQESEKESISIQIGEEITEERMKECSIITARYQVGNIAGILGVIGPTRMDYRKLVPLVDFTARSITAKHGNN